MNKDTIIKVLLAIIVLMVFAWLWRIVSGMLIGTLVRESHDVVCEEKAARACCCRRAKNQSGSDAR